uniref:Dual specificity protein kinase TTK n=3 Tax=Nothobranchius pienaari TaxID=704102 RepID=A0A1A8MPR5_9TELE
MYISVNRMEEEENTDRQQQLAKIFQKLNKMKQSLNEDDTDSINQVISSNSPESCLSYLMDLEKRGDPRLDHNHLTRLTDFCTKVFSNMHLKKHCQNESYARMLVRFAELKAIQDVSEAEANFDIARSQSPNFAFVHIAHAQFEHSQGNTKRAIHILQNAGELGAKPKEQLEAALQSLQRGRTQMGSEDKENLPTLSNYSVQSSVRKSSEFQKVGRNSDGTGDLQLFSSFNLRVEPSDDPLPAWRTGSQRKRAAAALPGRVPMLSVSIPENVDVSEIFSKRSAPSIPISLSRQTSVLRLSSSQKTTDERDLLSDQPPAPGPDHSQCTEQSDSSATLLHAQNTKDSSRMEDVTFTFDQIVNSNSPESCWAYLRNLEKRGDPHTDTRLLSKLKDCYCKVFARMPMREFSKNTSYARILVRYAELKGIEDPDEAQDNFIVARSSCKGFAFVHIAYAQFEVSQGNVSRATSILRKAQALKAKPAELLNTALSNLKAGKKQLVPPMEEDAPTGSVPSCGRNQDVQLPTRVPVPPPVGPPVAQPKPSSRELASEWKIPGPISLHISPEDKRATPLDPRPLSHLVESIHTPSVQPPSRLNSQAAFQTPDGYRNPRANSFITPVVKQDPEVPSSAAGHRTRPVQQPCTPLNQAANFKTPQAFSAWSNECITINGKQFFILKVIGRGGSSKVYQVLDHKKQLFAVKYVDLEEADAQTVESYRNEIEHLKHLQQYSDQIIKLYDYELTNGYIYMLMECGNLDLNTWLRNRKSVNPLERKFYWKNMLEAVQTIHKHGIVHSDLKPANFVIVNASLKLIDFGIANKIQPDVTSIMKDSQVGTLNYMPPEAIKDTSSSQPGKGRSKISPKGDVWSLGCILYCMTYGKTPFQSITNQISKLHAIIDPSHKIEFPNIPEKDLLDVLKRCLVRNPRERISIAELLEHPYLQLEAQSSPEPEQTCDRDLKRILTDLAALQSPSSIVRAANNLAKMCSSGRKLDVAECAKSSS